MGSHRVCYLPFVPRCFTQGSYRSEETGKCQGICVVREMSGKNIIVEKSGKMILDHAVCRYLWFFVSPNIKKQANLRLTLNVQKLDVFQFQGGALLPWPIDQCLCHLHIALLIPFHYLVPFMSGKLSFRGWKSQGILLQKTCSNPVYLPASSHPSNTSLV